MAIDRVGQTEDSQEQRALLATEPVAALVMLALSTQARTLKGLETAVRRAWLRHGGSALEWEPSIEPDEIANRLGYLRRSGLVEEVIKPGNAEFLRLTAVGVSLVAETIALIDKAVPRRGPTTLTVMETQFLRSFEKRRSWPKRI